MHKNSFSKISFFFKKICGIPLKNFQLIFFQPKVPLKSDPAKTGNDFSAKTIATLTVDKAKYYLVQGDTYEQNFFTTMFFFKF
jgi:hypothetical protein